MLEHPTITRVNRTGYPKMNVRRNLYAIDSMGQDVYTGDEMLVINDDLFLVEPLLQESVEILELLGATHETAK